jgi:SRSO17 transposase
MLAATIQADSQNWGVRLEYPLKLIGAFHMFHHIPLYSETILEEAGLADIPPFVIWEMLLEYLLEFKPYFWRKGQFKYFILAIVGLLSDLPKKNLENICLTYSTPKNKGNIYHFMREAKFDDSKMWEKYRSLLADVLSDPDGMITGDGCDFPKKGYSSVGADRQYCGSLGKTAICQAGVMVGYASKSGHGLISPDLYITEQMFNKKHDGKRKSWRVPELQKFQTKNEILADNINEAYASGQFKAKYVSVDSSFGNDHNFISSLPKRTYILCTYSSRQTGLCYSANDSYP